MKHWMRELILLLQELVDIAKDIRASNQQQKADADETLLGKNDVIALLKISDTTYRRYVRCGRLKPMRLRGIDMYRRKDILNELEESRRKGRL